MKNSLKDLIFTGISFFLTSSVNADFSIHKVPQGLRSVSAHTVIVAVCVDVPIP